MTIGKKDLEFLGNAIRSISHGGITGPEGLEMLSMSISGEGNGTPLAEAVDRCAQALDRIAEQLGNIANAIEEQ